MVLLLVVLGVGGLALTGPACDTKNPGQDLRELTQPKLIEQAVNRIKDLRASVSFQDTTRVLARPETINPATPGVIVNRMLAVKSAGQSSEVVMHHAGNGFIAYKLRMPDGVCGYVFSTDPIRVVSQ